jgi:hypothetical protein
MAKQKLNKNVLPLLAVTALLLSVSLVNYNDSVLIGSKSTQGVLSESDENKEEDKKDEDRGDDNNSKDSEKVEKSRDKEKERIEVRSVDSTRKVEPTRKAEPTRKPEYKENRLKLDVKENLEVKEKERSETEVKDDSDQEMESEFEQETETVSADGTVSKFKLKAKFKTLNGKTLVETSAGEVEVENSPEDAVNDLIADGVIDTPLEFEVKSENEKVEFEFKGVEAKRFLGLFDVKLPKTITVDANTGEVLSNKQTVWIKFLNLLSN